MGSLDQSLGGFNGDCLQAAWKGPPQRGQAQCNDFFCILKQDVWGMESLVVGIAPKKTGRLNFFLLDRCNACDFKPCQDISPNKTAQFAAQFPI